MPKPYLHFTLEEYAARQDMARARLDALGLDGLLIFKAEDMYWLTGYESDGFCIFGCMFLGVEVVCPVGLVDLVEPKEGKGWTGK